MSDAGICVNYMKLPFPLRPGGGVHGGEGMHAPEDLPLPPQAISIRDTCSSLKKGSDTD